jgi:hypothetical protein
MLLVVPCQHGRCAPCIFLLRVSSHKILPVGIVQAENRGGALSVVVDRGVTLGTASRHRFSVTLLIGLHQ